MTRFRTLFFVLAVTSAFTVLQGCSKDDSTVNPPPVNSSVNDTIRPIVFVHGMLEAGDAWVPMGQFFSLNAYPAANLNAVDFQNATAGAAPDVAAMASQLAAKVDEVLAATKVARVDIIAHGEGAKAVQYYLTKSGGTSKIAHVAFLGGVFDNSLTDGSGSLIPGPVKYITVRSNGQDALQTDASSGSLTGATNEQIAGLDHQQLLASGTAFAKMFTFFTAKTPTVTKLPRAKVSWPYAIKGRVLSMFDNLPVAGATVKFWYIGVSNPKGRQSNGTWRQVVTDANGSFTFNDTSRIISCLEILVQASGYYESHYYKTTWRADVPFERYRVLPKSGGSALQQSIRSSLVLNTNSTVAIFHSPYQAFYNNRDVMSVIADTGETMERTINLMNSGTGPVPGSTGSGKNAFMMFAFDYGANQQDGSGPMPVSALNSYGITSFDVYFDATLPASFSTLTVNQKSVYFQNFKSGYTGTNASGLIWVRYDYYDDSI